jgi:hypothetical protein
VVGQEKVLTYGLAFANKLPGISIGRARGEFWRWGPEEYYGLRTAVENLPRVESGKVLFFLEGFGAVTGLTSGIQ